MRAFHGPVAQQSERPTLTWCVAGATPAGATIYPDLARQVGHAAWKADTLGRASGPVLHAGARVAPGHGPHSKGANDDVDPRTHLLEGQDQVSRGRGPDHPSRRAEGQGRRPVGQAIKTPPASHPRGPEDRAPCAARLRLPARQASICHRAIIPAAALAVLDPDPPRRRREHQTVRWARLLGHRGGGSTSIVACREERGSCASQQRTPSATVATGSALARRPRIRALHPHVYVSRSVSPPPPADSRQRVFQPDSCTRWSPHLRCLPQRCGDCFLPDKLAPVVVSRRLPALLFHLDGYGHGRSCVRRA